MKTRVFALVMGIAFTLAGVGGFVPGITQPMPADAPSLSVTSNYGLLLGLFPINFIHNIYHLIVAAGGFLAYFRPSLARGYAQAAGVTLGVLTIMGLIPALSTTFGLAPVFGHDIWLHGVEAVIGLYLGFIAPPEPQETAQTLP